MQNLLNLNVNGLGNLLNAAAGGGNNQLMNMLNQAFGGEMRYNRVNHAKRLDLQWKTRARTWGDEATQVIERKRRKLEEMFSQPISEVENENGAHAEEPEDNSELVSRLIQHCDTLQADIAEMDRLAKQKDPLTMEQVRRISELEIQMYDKIMSRARDKIIEEQKRREEVQQLTTEMFEQIEDKWDSGVPDEDIRSYISEMLMEMYPNTKEDQLERFTNEVFRIGTSHLDVRIWLKQEQIDAIPIKKVSECENLAEDPRCSSCLDSFEPNDDVMCLPCDPKHIFHPDCIVPWFKRKTTCPLCKSDMRQWLDPNYEKPQPAQEEQQDENEANAEPVANRQLELLEQVLNTFFPNL